MVDILSTQQKLLIRQADLRVFFRAHKEGALFSLS